MSQESSGAPRSVPRRYPGMLRAVSGAPQLKPPPRQGQPLAKIRGVGKLSHPHQLPPQHGNSYRCAQTHVHGQTHARSPHRGSLGEWRGGVRPRTYPLSASCPPPPCPRLLARLARLSLAFAPSACPAAAAVPAWDAHSTATPRAIPSSRLRHIASPEPPGCERPPPPLRRRNPPVPAALSPTSLSKASCEGRNGERRGGRRVLKDRGKAGAAAPRPPPPAPAPRRRRPPASPALTRPREAAAAGDGEGLPGAARTLPSLQQHPRGLPLPHPPRTARGRHRRRRHHRSRSRSGAGSVSRA